MRRHSSMPMGWMSPAAMPLNQLAFPAAFASDGIATSAPSRHWNGSWSSTRICATPCPTGWSDQRSARRQPAPRASASEQNQRSPLRVLMRVRP